MPEVFFVGGLNADTIVSRPMVPCHEAYIEQGALACQSQ
jgi:hypothetical protein